MTRDDIIAQVQRNISFGMVPDGYRPDPAQLWPYSLSGGAESYGAESPIGHLMWHSLAEMQTQK